MLGQSISAVLIASLDGQAELQAGDKTFQLLLIPPLTRAYESLDCHAGCACQRKQNTAVGLLDAEVDVVVGLKHIADFLEGTVHAGYLLDDCIQWTGQGLTSFARWVSCLRQKEAAGRLRKVIQCLLVAVFQPALRGCS